MSRVNITDNDIFSKNGSNLRPDDDIYIEGHQAIDDPKYWPQPENFNWFWNLITNNLQYLLRNASLPWDGDEVYGLGAIVYVNENYFRSLSQNNTGNAPALNPDRWKWLNDPKYMEDKFFQKTGDTIKATAGGLTIQGTDNTMYLMAEDIDGDSNFYIGKPSVNSDMLRFFSYALNKGIVIDTTGFFTIVNGVLHKILTEDNAYDKNAADNTFYKKTGGVLSGTPIIQTTTGLNTVVAKTPEGVNQWYVGQASSADNTIRLYSYLLKSGLVIKEDALEAILNGVTRTILHSGNSYDKTEADNRFLKLDGGGVVSGGFGGLSTKSTSGINYFAAKSNNNVNLWYVGRPSEASTDASFHNYLAGTSLTLSSGQVQHTYGGKKYKAYDEGNIDEIFYKGSDSSELVFPVGHTLMGLVGANVTNDQLNQHTRMYRLNTSTLNIGLYGSDMYGNHIGEYLEGNWAFRGMSGSREGNWLGMFQRIS